LAEPFSEKYLRKLIGKNDIEDALKKLDRLTQEEARMVSVQILEVTNTINNGVEEIADNVLVVDNRVACVDDRIKEVDDRVKAVDEKLVAVTDGVQCISSQLSKFV
jgi:hypothetical protein